MKRKIKMILDISIFVLLAGVIIITPDINVHGHVFLGIALCILVIVHLISIRKWIFGIRREIKTEHAEGGLKIKYLLLLLFVITWIILIISSIFAALSYLGSVEGLDIVEDYIHPMSGRLGGILLVVHFVQNSKGIYASLSKK